MTQATDPFAATADFNEHHLQSILLVAGTFEQASLHALELTRRLNCQGETNKSCKNCRLLRANNFGDFIVVEPTTKASLGIEDVRLASKRLSLSPQPGAKVKVALFVADALTPEAQNALLKLAEEPPRATLVIFGSTTPGQLLETIRSRTRLVQLAPDQPLANHADGGSLLAKSMFERLVLAKSLSDNAAEVPALLASLQQAVLAELSTQPDRVRRRLAVLDTARTRLQSNTAVRPVLEHALLELG